MTSIIHFLNGSYKWYWATGRIRSGATLCFLAGTVHESDIYFRMKKEVHYLPQPYPVARKDLQYCSSTLIQDYSNAFQ
jgi:hypothetical protein